MQLPIPPDEGKARIFDWECLNPVIRWCYRDRVQPLYLHGEHGSDEMVAWLVLQGSIVIPSPEGPLTIPARHWCIPKPGPLRRDFSDDTKIISIRFQAIWTDKRHLFGEGLPISFPSQDFPKLKQESLKLLQFVEKNFSQSRTLLLAAETTLPVYLRLQSLFTNWLGTFIETLQTLGLEHTRIGKMDERVRRGLFLLDHLPLDHKFSKADVAHRLKLSGSQLDRLFVKATGFTPQKYFDQRRLNQARLILANTPASVKEVAFSLGFKAVSHFSTWFRRAEGVSPQGYIERLAKAPDLAADIRRRA